MFDDIEKNVLRKFLFVNCKYFFKRFSALKFPVTATEYYACKSVPSVESIKLMTIISLISNLNNFNLFCVVIVKY